MFKFDIKSSWKVLAFLGFHILCAFGALMVSQWIPKSSYLFFVLSFGVLGAVTTFLKFSHVLRFFNLFFYLGFYLKLSFHLIFSYPFAESIGKFVGETQEVHDFLWISSIAAVAVCLVSLIDWRFLGRFRDNKQNSTFPLFEKYYKFLFWLLALSCVAIAVVNIKLGINVSGLAAATILPRPFNALIGFLPSAGFSILIAVFAANEFKLKNKLTLTCILVLLEATFSTVSILSRGVFIFHFLPFLFCMYVLRDLLNHSRKQIILFCLAGFGLFVITGVLVTKGRASLYNDYNLEHTSYKEKNIFNFNEKQVPLGDKPNFVEIHRPAYDDNRRIIFETRRISLIPQKNTDVSSSVSFNGICRDSFICHSLFMGMQQVSRLVVDRWIGAEGLMAVVSYPHKDMSLIYKSLIRKPEVGKQDVFEEMSQSIYLPSQNYVFTSLPGPVAFFYYSAQAGVVFVGMILFLFLLLALQYGSQAILGNEFLKFQTAFTFAVSFMQFGISPRPLLVFLIMLFSLLFVLRFMTYRLSLVDKEKINL